MDEDRTATDKHPLDAVRDELIKRAKVRVATMDCYDTTRDALAALLEEEQGICARDSIRIAHAWLNQRPTPTQYRAN